MSLYENDLASAAESLPPSPHYSHLSPSSSTGDLYIDQDLIVPSRRISAMLTARGGGPIKAITREAIADLQAEMGRRVHLFLHVKVKEGAAAAASLH